MADRIDILLDDDLDLAVSPAGDFVTGIADQQHIRLIIEANQQEVRFDPEVGAGVRKALNGPVRNQGMVGTIKKQLEKDGYTNATVEMKNGEIDVQLP